jgi:HD-like signal output (HDOD) protein
MQLNALFDQPQALPSAPRVVQELISSFAAEDVSNRKIASTIATDQVVSAKVLRLANSVYFHASRAIGTVDDALAMLGFATVRTLVISSGLTGSFKPVKGFALESFWLCSLHVGVVAKWLAKKSRENQDLAFTVGLMHGIGQLVMHTAMPEECQRLNTKCAPWGDQRLAIEKAALGYDFAAVSAELARRWQFPDVFALTIAGFPDPLAQHPRNRLAAILHIGNWFARAQKNGLSVEAMETTFPGEIGALLGLDFRTINEEMPSLDELSDGLDNLILG